MKAAGIFYTGAHALATLARSRTPLPTRPPFSKQSEKTTAVLPLHKRTLPRVLKHTALTPDATYVPSTRPRTTIVAYRTTFCGGEYRHKTCDCEFTHYFERATLAFAHTVRRRYSPPDDE